MMKYSSRSFLLILSIVTLWISCSFTGLNYDHALMAESGQTSIEVILGAKEPLTGELENFVRVNGGEILDRNDHLQAVLVRVPADKESEFKTVMQQDMRIDYTEQNIQIKLDGIPNDFYWSQQWGPQKIQAPIAWDTQLGSNTVLVVVVDTGVDYTHLDLTANYQVGGYDWCNDDADPIDDHGHGTHVMGIVAATMNNELGVTGVAQVKVMAEKCLGSDGVGSSWDAAQAITHAIDVGSTISDRVIISNSWGSSDSSSTVHNAFIYAYNQGALLVAASGNTGSNGPHYPSGYPEVISVAATTQNDQLAYFSTYGDTIELAAPGYQILSTIPGNTYQYWSGTSMATPHVSGVAALIWSQFPQYTRDEVRELLQCSSDDLGASGWDQYFGYGRVNAATALNGLGCAVSWATSGLPSGWVKSGGTMISEEAKQSGTYGAYLKSYLLDPSGGWRANIYQDVLIPSNGESATLSFWYSYTSDEPEQGWDYFHVQIRDLNDIVLATVVSHSLSGQVPWTQVTYDLADFVGETIRLVFLNEEYPDGQYSSSVYVDDVSMEYVTDQGSSEGVYDGGFETGSFLPPTSVTLTVNDIEVTSIPPSYSTYYSEGSSLFFSVPNSITSSEITYNFDHWSDETTDPSHPPIELFSPQSFTAHYTQDYVITFDSDPRIASITVDGVTYPPLELPKTFQWEPESSHSFTVEPIINEDDQIRYIFTNWNDGNTSLSRTITINSARTYSAQFKIQYYLTVNTYPAGLDTPLGEGWYDEGTIASVSVSEVADHVFQYWYLDEEKTSSFSYDLTTTIEMDEKHIVTAYYKIVSTITMSINPSQITYGDSITLSGSITPETSNAIIKAYYSIDEGATWNTFLVLETDVNGLFEVEWVPQYPLTYKFHLSWDGDQDYLGATSGEHTVTVNGHRLSKRSMMINLEEENYYPGESILIKVTMFNARETPLESDLLLSIVGQGDYLYHDSKEILVPVGYRETYLFLWDVPTDAPVGIYLIEASLIPADLTTYDVTYVSIT